MVFLTHAIICAFSGAFALSPANPAVGASAPTTSVTVVLKDRFPQQHIVAIVRRTPGANGRDIIAILRSAVSPELLGAAMMTVAKARERQGATVSRTTTVVIPLGLKLPPLEAANRSRMAAAVNQLLVAPRQAVPAIGKVPAISLELLP